MDSEFDSIRPLSELNTLSGEGYPWISDDGLRIYFSKTNLSSIRIVVSEREHIDGLFGEPVELTINSLVTNNYSHD